MSKSSILLLSALLIAGCATSPSPDDSSPDTRVIHENAVLHEGPELIALVAYNQGKRSVVDESLILAVELTKPRGSKPVILNRRDITVRTPDGRRLELLSQDEFISTFVTIRIAMDRTLAFLPLLNRFHPSRLPCDRWFFEISPERVAYEEFPLSSSQTCRGPLVFNVPGGIQSGRWRLVVELEETQSEIPFVIEF